MKKLTKQNMRTALLIAIWAFALILYTAYGWDYSSKLDYHSITIGFFFAVELPFMMISGMYCGCVTGILKRKVSKIIFSAISFAVYILSCKIISIPFKTKYAAQIAIDKSGSLNPEAVGRQVIGDTLSPMFYLCAFATGIISVFIYRKITAVCEKKGGEMPEKGTRVFFTAICSLLVFVAIIALFLLIFNIVEGMI